MELPPHARRIQKIGGGKINNFGTTSACAENTLGLVCDRGFSWNYLRVRGEYSPRRVQSASPVELPPRTRRIHIPEGHRDHKPGTTSVCAENTWRGALRGCSRWNYLRVRGEYILLFDNTIPAVELPPRARRILDPTDQYFDIRGTTSACAENTPMDRRSVNFPGNYLRVRGEYGSLVSSVIYSMELPPRARRIPLICSGVSFLLGTTSACAENTKQRLFSKRMLGNYLRVRGEYTGPKPSAVK